MDSAQPLVTVIIPSFNSSPFIETAIQSVLKQTYPSYEIIIVDDGSRDNSMELLKKLGGQHPELIRIYTHPDHQNLGLGETYRLGIQHAHGEWIAFLEQDDYWVPENLAKKITAFERFPDAGIVYSNVKPFGDLNSQKGRQRVISARKSNWTVKRLKSIYLTNRFLGENPILTMSTVIVRSNLVKQAMMIDLHDSQFDWLFLAGLSSQHQFVRVPEALVYWRLHTESFHHKTVVSKKAMGRRWLHFKFFFHLAGQLIKQARGFRKAVVIFLAVHRFVYLVLDFLIALIIKTTVVSYQILTGTHPIIRDGRSSAKTGL